MENKQEITNKEAERKKIAAKFQDLSYQTMPYRLFVPDNYDPNQTYPLVLFLHGSGERGTDNQKHILSSEGATVWATPENQSKHPSFVLAPQSRECSDGGFSITRDLENQSSLDRVFEFSTDLERAYDILQRVLEQYSIDRNRIYCTGLSQGGFGTYNLNMAYPDLFAAMVPIASGGDPEKAHLIAKKPIWNFHAEDDAVIPVTYSRTIIEALKKSGGNPIYTEYESEKKYNHGSWVPAYENLDMVEWVYKQRLSLNECAPSTS